MSKKIYNKSESLGKHAARAWAYAKLPKKILYTKRHIVIASQECGDIKFLTQFGVEPKNIIACDIDKVAVDEAEKLGVIFSHLNILDVVRATVKFIGMGAIGSVNVDLCSTLVKSIDIIRQVNQMVSGDVHVFYTFERARDGMFSRAERMKRIEEFSDYPFDDCFEYQSFGKGKNDVGSPMCVLYWGPTMSVQV